MAPVLERVNTLVVVLACLELSWLSPDASKYGERLFCLIAFFLGHWLAQRPARLDRLTTGRVALAALPVAIALPAYALGADRRMIYAGPVMSAPVACGLLVLIAAARAPWPGTPPPSPWPSWAGIRSSSTRRTPRSPTW